MMAEYADTYATAPNLYPKEGKIYQKFQSGHQTEKF
jgi:hypothetical protein